MRLQTGLYTENNLDKTENRTAAWESRDWARRKMTWNQSSWPTAIVFVYPFPKYSSLPTEPRWISKGIQTGIVQTVVIFFA